MLWLDRAPFFARARAVRRLWAVPTSATPSPASASSAAVATAVAVPVGAGPPSGAAAGVGAERAARIEKQRTARTEVLLLLGGESKASPADATAAAATAAAAPAVRVQGSAAVSSPRTISKQRSARWEAAEEGYGATQVAELIVTLQRDLEELTLARGGLRSHHVAAPTVATPFSCPD